MLVVTGLNIIVVSMAYFARIEKYRYLLGWAFALLAIVLGIRYGYGNDYFSYKYLFDKGIPEQGFIEDVEPGWLLLNKLFKPFGFSTMIFFLTCVEHLLMYKLIQKYVQPEYYWLAVFIYVFNWFYMLIGLSMMRQFLVEIIGLYAMGCVIKKKYLSFLLLFVFSFFIHKVALLFFPFLILPFMKMPRWWVLAIFFVLFFWVFNNMMEIIDLLVVLIQGTNMKYADSYLTDELLREEYRMGLRTILPFIVYFILFVRNVKFLSKDNQIFSWMAVVGLFIVPFGTISPWAFRAVWIYSIAEILFLPQLISKERIPALKYFLAILYFISIFLQYSDFFSSDTYGEYYISFKTIFI